MQRTSGGGTPRGEQLRDELHLARTASGQHGDRARTRGLHRSVRRDVDASVGTAIVSMQGEMLGMDETARRIGGSLGWNIN